MEEEEDKQEEDKREEGGGSGGERTRRTTPGKGKKRKRTTQATTSEQMETGKGVDPTTPQPKDKSKSATPKAKKTPKTPKTPKPTQRRTIPRKPLPEPSLWCTKHGRECFSPTLTSSMACVRRGSNPNKAANHVGKTAASAGSSSRRPPRKAPEAPDSDQEDASVAVLSTQEDARRERAAATSGDKAQRIQKDGTIKVRGIIANQKLHANFVPNTTVKTMLENFEIQTQTNGYSGVSWPVAAYAIDKKKKNHDPKATADEIWLTHGSLNYVLPTEMPTLWIHGCVLSQTTHFHTNNILITLSSFLQNSGRRAACSESIFHLG